MGKMKEAWMEYEQYSSLFHSMVESGYNRANAVKTINRLFNKAFALCEDCNDSLADTYEYEGREWSLCPKCEGAKPTINDLTREWAESNA